jgi:hypothetical protein
MNEIHRTPQQRRDPLWTALAAVGTVAAAALLVIAGLSFVGRGPIGEDPSQSPAPQQPTPTADASESPTAEPSPTPTRDATASPTAEPTAGAGEFGPIHSMAPDDAFDNPQSCEVANAIDTVGDETGISYSLAFPEGWFTNEATDRRSACTLFAEEEFAYSDDAPMPEEVAIVSNLPPGGDLGPGGTITSVEEFTVDGRPAARYEIEPEPGGFIREAAVLWVVGVAGQMPAEGNDRPYLVMSTSSADADELARLGDVLDRMVATIDIADE